MRFRYGKRPEYSVIHLRSCYTVGILSVVASACKRPFLYGSIFFCRQLCFKRVYCGFQLTRCIFAAIINAVKRSFSHSACRKQGHIPLCAGNTVSVIADYTPCTGIFFMVLPEIHGRRGRCVYIFIQCVCAKLYRLSCIRRKRHGGEHTRRHAKAEQDTEYSFFHWLSSSCSCRFGLSAPSFF